MEGDGRVQERPLVKLTRVLWMVNKRRGMMTNGTSPPGRLTQPRLSRLPFAAKQRFRRDGVISGLVVDIVNVLRLTHLGSGVCVAAVPELGMPLS